MKPIFCGNLDYDARQYDLERLFKRYGKVERVDIKSGFAFVYMEDERDAEDAIRRLDQHEFGRKGRRLRVEWTKQDRDNKRSGGGRRPAANDRPSKTLFVINFDPINTRSSDLEKHFELHGKIVNIRIRRNFAFIQFESIEDATRTLEATNMSKLMDRVITVEYATKDDDDRGNGHSPGKRGRDMPPGRGFERRRSPSPYRRERGSPDYGHRRDRDSPDYGHHHRGRNSPDYGHHHRGRNSPDHRGDRNSPDYGHGINRSSRADTRGSADFAGGASPANGKYNRRSPPPRDRSVERSPPPRERLRERSASPRERSPPRRAVRSPPPRERLRERSVSPRERSPPRRSMRSPPPRERLRERSVSPRERLRERSEKLQERSVSPRGRSLSSRERSTEKSSPPREGSPLPREMGEVVE